MPTKQWLQVEAGNEIVMYFLYSFISSLDFKSLSVPIEVNSGSVSSQRWQNPQTINTKMLNLVLVSVFFSPLPLDSKKWRTMFQLKVFEKTQSNLSEEEFDDDGDQLLGKNFLEDKAFKTKTTQM